MSTRRAHLTAFLTGVGYHESAWKLADPADLTGSARFGVLERATLTAERGLLDAVFFADSPGLAIFRARYSPAGSPPSTTCRVAGQAGTS
jgi:N-acetyl-S-(2-succino)cysteine monooxygenase